MLYLLAFVWVMGGYMFFSTMFLFGVYMTGFLPRLVVCIVWPFAILYGGLYVQFMHKNKRDT